MGLHVPGNLTLSPVLCGRRYLPPDDSCHHVCASLQLRQIGGGGAAVHSWWWPAKYTSRPVLQGSQRSGGWQGGWRSI
ncbi:hypothetical protein E2C01_063867 [Portunus trituberculatus]|uniref:Uncharacterized protein n=1 Tax=Portunus trituberculatus TaxID=210409 RepID=A0A5B7HK70_PORTR|nr:hypothetical protein [Portunus trituberculatus]